MASVRPFHRYRGESSFTMAQLIGILGELLPQIVPSQSRYRVTELPTARTIRFYTAIGLVDKPGSRSGASSLYGYRHLLQVLALKYLQSQYLPLVKIRSLVENISNRDLELIIPDIAPVTAAHRGIAREDKKVADISLYRHVEKVPATEMPSPPDHPGRAISGATSADTWHHIEVGPGIELQVHTAALSAENCDRLRGALLRELGLLRGWFGEEKR